MSTRHRSAELITPARVELRAHARAERHRVNTELHEVTSALAAGLPPEDALEPGMAWKPVHHHDADKAKDQVGAGRRRRALRHWKVKAWKRRTTLRRAKASAFRLAAE